LVGFIGLNPKNPTNTKNPMRGAEWLIKRNPWRESEEEWLAMAEGCGGKPENGEEVWWGGRWVTRKGMEDPLRPYCVA
jgi:hypothetical protein